MLVVLHDCIIQCYYCISYEMLISMQLITQIIIISLDWRLFSWLSNIKNDILLTKKCAQNDI